MAILLTIISFFMILTWTENYGHTTCEVVNNDSSNSAPPKPQSSMLASLGESLALIRANSAILCLGLSQAFFEGGIYTFGEYALLLISFVLPQCNHVYTYIDTHIYIHTCIHYFFFPVIFIMTKLLFSFYVGSISPIAGSRGKWLASHRVNIFVFYAIDDCGWDDIWTTIGNFPERFNANL